MRERPAVLPPLDDDAITEAMQQLKEQMLRDAQSVWRSLVAQAQYGFDEVTKFQAQKLVLAYTLGVPVERHEVKQVSSGPRRQAPALEDMTAEELHALAVLREGQRRRALESGEDSDE